MENKGFFYSFLDNTYSYNCNKCNGTCCNINGELLLTKEEYIEIVPNKLKVFCKDIQNGIWKYKLNTPKKCWYLKNNKCILKKRPLVCDMYPTFLNTLSNGIVCIDYTICPTLCNNNIITYKGIENILRSSICEDMIISLDYSDSQLEFIQIENEFRDNLKLYKDKIQYEKYILYSLFTTIRLNKLIINITEEKKASLFKHYQRLIDKYLNSSNNYQNIFIMAKYNLIYNFLEE